MSLKNHKSFPPLPKFLNIGASATENCAGSDAYDCDDDGVIEG